jgi:hypothetical protein
MPTGRSFKVHEDRLFQPTHCDCCGQRTQSLSGWLSTFDGTTVAAYLMNWTESRPDHNANIDLVIGKWGEFASPADRKGASLLFNRSGGGFMVIDAATRAFSSNQALFTQALSRLDIVGTPFSKENFDMVDAIWLQDTRIDEVRGEKI